MLKMAKDNYTQLNVKCSTKELIVDKCKAEILLYNPKLVGMKLSHDYICRYIAEHFLKD
jgi:hypothetical protein